MELASAIKELGAVNRCWINRAAAAMMAKLRGSAERQESALRIETGRERTLLELLSEDSTNRQIAARCSGREQR